MQHPFALKADLVYHNDSWKTSELVMEQRPLEEKFPVSSGINHKVDTIVAIPTTPVINEVINNYYIL